MTHLPYFHRELSSFRNGLIAVWMIVSSCWVIAQEVNPLVPEKIYLQLDNRVYTKDQTIWIKAVVTDVRYHMPSQLSSVLYVDLIGPGETIIDSKILKLKDGIGSGHFDLRQQYVEGAYLIRAYTRWNQNFGPDYFFQDYVQLLSTSTEAPPTPISTVKFLKREGENPVLQVQFDPLVIDRDHKQKLSVCVSLEDKKDSLLIKPNREGAYELTYQLPAKGNFVTLSLETENLATYSKTFVLDDTYLDVQFFPESGYLVHGLSSKVGLKALDANGKGMYIAGEILTQQGELIMPFTSNELGMGYLMLPLVDSAQTYIAKLSSPVEKIIPLPAVVHRGNVLSVGKVDQQIRVKASSNYLQQDSLIIKVSCRGEDYFEVKGQLKGEQLTFNLPSKSLPEGIIAFTMTDIAHHPLAERLFFNERPKSRLTLNITPNKNTYLQREESQVEVQVLDSERLPVPAKISVQVINADQLGKISNTREQILSYFLLSSDLTGAIETPGFYFQEGGSRHQDLDALMLTQGWRRYLYNQPITERLIHPPETSLSISGRVKTGPLKRKKEEVQMTLVSMGDSRLFQVQSLDSLGGFQFPIEDEYGEDLRILLQTANKLGKNKAYTIELEQAEPPDITYEHVQAIFKIDSTIQDLVEKNLMRKKIKDAFRVSEEGITLDEVVIEGYQMSPQRRRAWDEFGKPREIISGKEIQAKEEEWSSGLFSVLMYHYPDKIKIVRQGDNLYARVIGTPTLEPGDGVTLVSVDGVLVREEDYDYIPNIPPEEVKSVEIIRGARNFAQHYMEVVPGTSLLEAPTMGSVLSIYTREGRGLFATQKPVGLLHTSVPVFSTQKEFYAPAYPDSSTYNWTKPDLRALVHWDPILEADNDGEAITTFYNADNLGKMRIIVEAISPDGEIGYKEGWFTVEAFDER